MVVTIDMIVISVLRPAKDQTCGSRLVAERSWSVVDGISQSDRHQFCTAFRYWKFNCASGRRKIAAAARRESNDRGQCMIVRVGRSVDDDDDDRDDDNNVDGATDATTFKLEGNLTKWLKVLFHCEMHFLSLQNINMLF